MISVISAASGEADTQVPASGGVPEGFSAKRSGGQTHDEGTLMLAVGGSVSGVVDIADDTDTVSMTLTAGTYLLSVVGSGTTPLEDTYLTSSGLGLTDDDGGIGTGSLLTFTVATAGTYTFAVSGYPGYGQTGGYTVHLEQRGADSVPGTIASTVAATPGVSTFGFIETDGDVDVYRVSLTAGGVYDIELAGGADYDSNPALPAGELDTVLTVYDAAGSIVFTNDDIDVDTGQIGSGGQFQVQSGGDYYIEVKAYAGNTGGYQLDIDEVDLSGLDPLDAIDWGVDSVAQDGPLNDGVFYVYFAEVGETFGGVTSLGWTAYERQQAMAAWNTFSTFADVTFAVTTDQSLATFTLTTVEDDNSLGAFYPPGTANAGLGWFAINGYGWDRDGSVGGLEPGGYSWDILLHEFGHGLGLKHPHDVTNGTGDIIPGVTGPFGSYGAYNLNQGIYTVMTYNDGWPLHPDAASPFPLEAWGNTETAMAFDIAVLQAKYGAVACNEGKTVYQFDNANVRGTSYMCIWDTGGIDMIRYGGTADAIIDLRAATLDYSPTGGGVISWVDGIFGGFTIAHGVVIENAKGGSGNDSVTGNGADNNMVGLTGRDALAGLDGADTLNGGGGVDTLDGGAGDDILTGGVGKDKLTGGAGLDQFVYVDGDLAFERSLTDTITDFSQAQGDRLKLKSMDANTLLAGDQKFVFIGAGAFTGAAGQLHYVQAGGNTYVEGDTNGDGLGDFSLRLNGLIALAASDFVL